MLSVLALDRRQRVSRLYGLRRTLCNKDRFCETMGAALDAEREKATRSSADDATTVLFVRAAAMMSHDDEVLPVTTAPLTTKLLARLSERPLAVKRDGGEGSRATSSGRRRKARSMGGCASTGGAL
jgi:hypothetical protein